MSRVQHHTFIGMEKYVQNIEWTESYIRSQPGSIMRM